MAEDLESMCQDLPIFISYAGHNHILIDALCRVAWDAVRVHTEAPFAGDLPSLCAYSQATATACTVTHVFHSHLCEASHGGPE